MSGNWEYEEYQFRDILVHEMIHYYLAYTGKDIIGTHGREFQMMSYSLNHKYGLNITELICYDEYTRRKGTSLLKYLIARLF
jgi:predicted SprT family Zn-dependent metalloprotease